MHLRPLDLITTTTFSVLTAIGALMFVPVYPVPITFQTLFTYLSGAVLGPWLGALSQVIYIILGGIGLPIFAGGKAGFGVLAGPTGGYLFGFIAASFVIGNTSDLRMNPSAARIAVSFIVGTLIIYTFGITQLSQWMNGNVQDAILVGVLPFIVGDAVKVAIAVIVATRLRGILPRTNLYVKASKTHAAADPNRDKNHTRSASEN
jgi:biotin transport system substrate-specific component